MLSGFLYSIKSINSIFTMKIKGYKNLTFRINMILFTAKFFTIQGELEWNPNSKKIFLVTQ